MISITGLVSAIALLLGLAIMFFGVLGIGAASMSSNPSQAHRLSRQGCNTFLVGAALLVAGIWGIGQ